MFTARNARPNTSRLRLVFENNALPSMVASLDAESKLLSEILLIRPLSTALVFAPGRAVTVDADEFFRQIAQDVDWLTSQPRIVVQLVEFLLDCFDRMNRHRLLNSHNVMQLTLDSAAEAAGYAMANTLIQAHVHAVMQDAPFDAAAIVITLVLASTPDYGHMHPLHRHPLVPSNGIIVFDAAHLGRPTTTTWPCSICHRSALVKTDVVYRCGGCDINLCKECYTRIPHGSASPSPAPRNLRHLAGLWPHSLRVLCGADMSTVALETALVLRRRVMELPLTAGTNFVAIVSVLEDMVASKPFCAALVRSSAWIPAIVSGKSIEIASFLGPFFRHCSLPDDVVPGDIMCGPTADTARTKARDLLQAVQASLTSIVRTLISHGGAIKEAMLCWVACAIEANSVRRRLGHSPVECASDGFLINVAAVVLEFAQSADVTTIDPSYHMGFAGRVSFAENTRILPKAASDADTVPPPPPLPVHEYYPRYDAHLGVVCDHCQEKDFVGLRFKCVSCDDYDLCARCYEHSHHQHPSSHLFLRLAIPLPQVTTWPYRKLPEPNFDDEAAQPTSTLITCHGCHVERMQSHVLQCSQCDRTVCTTCVQLEEAEAKGNPHRLHAPGHHYIVMPVSMWLGGAASLRLLQSLYPPQFFPLRRDDDGDAWWYMALKCLHVGPVLTLMRYVSVHREYQQLKALCNMENRSRQQSQVAAHHRRSARSAHSLNANANHVRVEELLKTKSAMEVQLFAPSFLRAVFGFYMGVAKWITKLLDMKDPWTLDANRAVPPEYASAPEAVLCNLADVLYLVGVHPCDGIEWSSVDLEPLVSLLFYLLAMRQLTNSPHVRVQLVRALLSIAPLVRPGDTSRAPVVYTVVANSPFLRAHAVDCLLAFHHDLDQYSSSTGGDTSWGLLPARLSTLLLLRWLWNNPTSQPQVSDEAVDDRVQHGIVLLFSGVLHDITRLLDEANVKVQAMRRLQELQESPSSATGAYFQPAMMQSYMALHFNKARTTFRVLIECLELLAWIAAVPSLRAVLCRRSLVDQTASTLSFVVVTLETQLHPTRWGFSAEIYQDGMLALAEALIIVVRCAGLHTNCPEASSWKLSNYAGILMEEKIGDLDVHQRWKLSSCLFRLEKESRKMSIDDEPAMEDPDDDGSMSSSSGDENAALALLEDKAARQRQSDDAERRQRHLATRFIGALAADGRFESVRFRRAAVLLRSDPSLTSVWREKFLQVVEQTEQLMTLHEEMETRLGAVPDEYLDPILHTLMLHPVQLPSGHIVDRTMIERHLLSASVNPFSREPLTLDMLLPCTELQQQIERFVRSKLVRNNDDSSRPNDRDAWGLGWDCLFDQPTHPTN
ncbi:Ubiquitin conjugation factor E4 B [Aphanomyces cochlioides]|nr:Ubiquitin conjugation factor E4 B [Aphanomyces cochlioides]